MPAAVPRSGRSGGAPTLLDDERSPARVTALIVGGVIAGVVVLVVILSSLGGGGSNKASSNATATTSAQSSSSSSGTHTTASTPTGGESSSAAAASPADTRVAVLNGTETQGLAHRLSSNLQQSGYTQASALEARPAGSHPSTVVEYASGHRADAEQVAKTLGVTQVQPLDSITAPLVGSAAVVVLAGADQAALVAGAR
jgi:hypothetical protein